MDGHIRREVYHTKRYQVVGLENYLQSLGGAETMVASRLEQR